MMAAGAGVILLDEDQARSAAARLGLRVTGVVGVLLRAKRMGMIDSAAAEIAALRRDAGFFIARRLKEFVLREAGESSS